MKKLILLLTLLSFTQVSSAEEKKWLQYLKTYGIPCAASLAAGALLVEDDGLGVGLVGCAASSATIYVLEESKMKNPLSAEEMEIIRGQVQASVRDEVGELQNTFKAAVEKSLNKALDKNSDDIAKSLQMQSEETKSLMREVMAAQLVEIKEEMKIDLFKKVEAGEFMPKLKENIKMLTEKTVDEVFQENKKSIIEKATELTIKEVIVKEVGVPSE